jgi:hypothetical protein
MTDHLYFIQAETGQIKIGRAANPEKRLCQLKSGCFVRLTLLGRLEGRGYEEKVWHSAFQDDRLAGEWFADTRELKEAIRLALLGKPWWDHLTPPLGFPLSDDENEWDDDVVDWQIAVQIAVAEASAGRFRGTHTPKKMLDVSEQRILAYLEAAAAPPHPHPNGGICD